MNDLELDYDEIEQQQQQDLPSEFEDNEMDLQRSYDDYLQEQGELLPVKSIDERFNKMKNDALAVYEQGLNDSSIAFSQRRQVADKVLEITGVIKKDRTSDGPGNTFIFSDNFAERLLQVAEKVKNNFTDLHPRELRDVN
jgi:t-SNARE complex subunit (syntaxin)